MHHTGWWGEGTHQLLFWQDLPVLSEFLAAPSLAFANRRRTWGEVVEGPVCVVLGQEGGLRYTRSAILQSSCQANCFC